MTTTPPPAPPGHDQGPRTTRDDIRDLGRLRRSTTDRHIAGVAGGLARHLDIDPLVVRVALVVLVFFGGSGLLLYGALWLMVPEDDGSEAVVDLDDRTRAFALIVAGVLAGLALLGDSVGWVHFPWPLAIVAAVVLVLLARSPRGDRSAESRPSWMPPPPAGWTPPPPPPAPQWAQPPGTPYAAPRNPRRRGPVLFWFTLALVALGLGTLGLLDVAGAGIPESAYPALVVATCGVMLVVGAFYGRAGGLILVGLLATVGMVVATAADKWDGEHLEVTPTSATDLDDLYRMEAGEMSVDLTEVEDLDGLDGRVLELHSNVGRIEVVVPDEGLDVEVVADVSGPGNIVFFGRQNGGIDVTREGEFDGGTGVPELVIDARIDVGEIDIRTASDLRSDRFDWRNR